MARKSAAQIAQEELEKSKAAQATSEASEGDIVEPGANALTESNDATIGDSGKDGGSPEPEPEPVKLPEHEKVHAVALRDLPGVGVKVGRIILAPQNIVKQWDAVSWVDTHEDALKFAEHRYQQQKMSDPRFSEPMIFELDAKGQIMSESDEG